MDLQTLTRYDVNVGYVFRRQIDDLRTLLERVPQHVLLRLGPAKPVDPDDVEATFLNLLDATLDDQRDRKPARLTIEDAFEASSEESASDASEWSRES